jgi:flagellar protein FlaG
MNINPIEVNTAATAAVSKAAMAHIPPSDAAPQAYTQGTRSPDEGRDEVKQMVVEMQDQISRMNVSLEFSTYGDSGEKISVVVTDKETGEVIREIPSKEIQDLYAKMTELTGMIFNGRA